VAKELEKRQICTFSTQQGDLSDGYQAGYRQGGGMTVAAPARSSVLLDEHLKAADEFSSGDYFNGL